MFRLFRVLFLAKSGSLIRLFLIFTLALTGFLSIRELTENVERLVAQEVRPFLGGDISISKNEFVSGGLLQNIAPKLVGIPYQAMEKLDFNTTLFDRNQNTELVRIIAYSGSYPLYGALVTEPSGYSGSALVSYGVRDKFMSGSSITLEGREIAVGGYIKESSEVSLSFGNEGNLVILPRELLSGSTLLSAEARIESSLLLKLPSDAVTDSLYTKLKSDKTLSQYNIRSYRTNAARASQSIEELSRYTLLVLVVAAIFAGIVLLSANETLLSWLSHSFGILELLGLTRRKKIVLVAALYILLILASFVASVLISYGILRLMTQIEQAKGFVFLLSPVVFLVKVMGALVFATLPPSVLRFIRKKPLESIRTSIGFANRSTVLTSLFFSIIGLFLMLFAIFDNPLQSLLITTVIVTSILILVYIFQKIFALIFRISSSLRRENFFRFDGIRTLVRPLMPSWLIGLSVVFAFTLFFVFLTVSLTFQDRLKISSKDSTNIYTINILERDATKVRSTFPNDQLFSILRARIIQINGKSIAEHLGNIRPSNEFTREFNVTSNPLENAPIIRWERPLGPEDVSVDADFADSIRVTLGDRIRFSLSWKLFDLTVKNIRKTEREWFRPFFYFQVNQTAFSNAPKTYFLASSAPDIEAFKKRMLAITGSHVTFVDVWAILTIVRSVASRILSVIGLFLAFVSVFALLAILTLFQSFEPLARMKSRLYHIFWATASEMKQSLRTTSVVLLLLGIVLSFVIGCIVFFVLLGRLSFLTFSLPIFALSSALLFVAWGVLTYALMRIVSGYAKA